MPSISIIIPVYNTERYLRECLDSIINQSFQDFEVICINDGSTDRSSDILNEYSKKDTRFIIINKKNEGQGVARNIGIEKANGKYLISVDSDDWLEKNALELLYNKIETDNVDILFFDYCRFYEASQKKTLIKYTDIYKTFENEPFTSLQAGKILFNTNSLLFKIYKTDFIKRNHIKYSNHKFMEDTPVYIKSMLYANKISCLSEAIYNYRIFKKSSNFNYKNYITNIPEVFEICFNIIENFNPEKDIFESFIENRKKSLLYYYSITPFYVKPLYYKMMQQVINKHFKKYDLSEELNEISTQSYLQYLLSKKIKKTICILKTYFI